MISRCFFLLSFAFCSFVFGQWSGKGCTVERTSSPGICKILESCPVVITAIERHRRYTRCGYEGENQIVCCPEPIIRTTTTPAPEINENSPISQRKCREYSKFVFEEVPILGRRFDQDPDKMQIDQCGNKVSPLIVGGTRADPKEFPHMAAIGFEIDESVIMWACGGTLISDQFVLTAAHCLHSDTLGEPKFIRLGDLNLLSDREVSRPETFNISAIIRHPDFINGSKYNDIGLLKLYRKVQFNPYIRPACLPSAFNISNQDTIATGWGHTEWAGKGSNHLLKVTLQRFDHAECNASISSQRQGLEIRDDIQLCAGSSTKRKDSCQGDSGGPLQIYHPHEYCMYTVVGITSFGVTCAIVNVPGVYTRVFPYVGWIEQVVWG